MDQWLGFCASTAEGMNLIPGQGTKIHMPCYVARKKREKRKQKESKKANVEQC